MTKIHLKMLIKLQFSLKLHLTLYIGQTALRIYLSDQAFSFKYGTLLFYLPSRIV